MRTYETKLAVDPRTVVSAITDITDEDKSRRVTISIRYLICGMPETLRAVEILADARRRLSAEVGS